MLEILFIIFLFKKFKAITSKKNRSKWLPWIVPVFWFGGEFAFPFFAAIVHILIGKPIENNLIAYAYALLGGFVGAGIAFLIAHLLPTKTLSCPKCGWEFTKASRAGVECEGCKTTLKVFEGKVSTLQNA